MRAICVLLIVSVGCYSWRTVPKDQIPARIEKGDKVRVTTTTGEKPIFHVVRIGPDSISGDGIRLSLDQIEKLELRRFSVFKTGLAAGGYVAVLVAVAVGATVGVLALAFG